MKPHLIRLAVDFDGVIHSYEHGWQGGVIYGPPVDGCWDALRELSKRYEMVVFTARYDLAAVRKYLLEWNMSHFFHDVTNRKPEAAVYLDDRAMKFVNWHQALSELL